MAITCRGSFRLGTACGRCERCDRELAKMAAGKVEGSGQMPPADWQPPAVNFERMSVREVIEAAKHMATLAQQSAEIIRELITEADGVAYGRAEGFLKANFPAEYNKIGMAKEKKIDPR